jgi:hypothetical protein
MGWDYSGTEDEFFKYCESNSSPENQYYWEDNIQSPEGINSYFLDKFNLTQNLISNSCSPFHIEQIKAKIPNEIIEYFNETSLLLLYDVGGKRIQDLDEYHDRIRIRDISLYNLRKEIFSFRKLLREKTNYGKYIELKQEKSFQIKNPDYIMPFDENDVWDIITCRFKYNLSDPIIDPLIRLLIIATLYHNSNNYLKNSQYDFKELKKESEYSPFDKFYDRHSKKNLVESCDFSKTYKVLEQFLEVKKRLGESFELFIGYKFGNDDSLNELSFNTDNNANMVVVKSKKYHLTIEKTTSILGKDAVKLSLFELDNETLLLMFSMVTKPNLEFFFLLLR